MKSVVAKRVRWTVKDYLRMSLAGLLDDRRAELLNGVLIEMPAQALPHMASISKTAPLLFTAFGPGYWVVVQGTLILSRFEAPEPDFHVYGVPVGTPRRHRPLPLLVIEISDSTYRKDSGPKLRTYARAVIPDYWIVNIAERCIEVYRQPEDPTGRRRDCRYADVTSYGPGQTISPLRRPDLTFAVDAMLP